MSKQPNYLECKNMFDNITSDKLNDLINSVKSGLNPNCHNIYNNSYSPLYGAVMYGKFDAVKFLLSNGADVNYRSGNGETALTAASQSGNMDIFNYLLSNNADPNIASKSGLTPLLQASATGNLDMVNSLLARNADVNAKMVDGSTSLHMAADARSIDVIKTLVAANPKIVQVTNTYGKTALDYHIINGYSYSAQKRLDEMARANPSNENLVSANEYSKKTVATMKVLLENGTSCSQSCLDRLFLNPELKAAAELYGATHHDDTTAL